MRYPKNIPRHHQWHLQSLMPDISYDYVLNIIARADMVMVDKFSLNTHEISS